MPPIVLDGTWVIGLIDFHTYNSIPNVDETNNIIGIGDQHFIEIPVGAYEIEEINGYLNEKLTISGNYIVLRGNNNTLKCEIESDVDVDLTHPRSIAPLLGFRPQVLEARKQHISNQPVNILKVDDIRIECSLACGAFDNGRPSNVIYGFYPEVPHGYKLIQRPATIIYYPITTNVISNIKVRIIDQKNRPINFRNEHITVRLQLLQT